MSKGEQMQGATALGAGERILGALALVVVTLAVYWPSLRGELVYDDLYLIGQNPQIRSFAHLPEIFGSAYWDFLDDEAVSTIGYYRPLSTMLLMVGYALGGGSPVVFHVFSILLHIAAALAAWLFIARLLRNERVGFWAALLFALHPVQVEGVAWISAVNVPLFGFFSLLALASWVAWRRGAARGMPVVAGLLLLCALFSKEAAAAVLPIALIIDIVRGKPAAEGAEQPAPAPLLRAYAPFAIALLVYYLARVQTFGDWAAGFDRITTDFGVSSGRLALLRIELLGGSVGLLALPLELDLFRPFSPRLALGSRGFLEPLAWSLLLVAAITWFALRRQRPWLALSLLIPAALLPILINVHSLGTFPLSERFLYLPVIGFTALVAGLALTKLPRPIALGGLVLLAGAYAWQDTRRIRDWRDESALFAKAVEQHPYSPSAHWGLGRVQLVRYRESGERELLTSARASYERAMDLLEQAGTDGSIFATSDDHRQANLGLAWTLLFQAETDPFRDFATPRTIFERVTWRYPNYYMGWIGLGVAFAQEGNLDAAGAAFRKGLDLNPRSIEGHSNMASLMLALHDWPAAEKHYRAALEHRPEHVGDMVGLARALEFQGRMDEAWRTALQAHELAPDNAGPALELGILSMQGGNLPEALRWFDAATTNAPMLGPAHFQRGTALLLLGRPKEAALALEKACELMPTDFRAFYNLAMVLLESEEPRAAIPVLARAYALRRNDQLGTAVYQNLVDIGIEDADLLFHLAVVDADRNERQRAEEWAGRALERDPEHAPSHMAVGLILLEEERHEEAAVHLLQAAGKLTDSHRAQMEAGNVLLRLGRTAEALPFLQRALRALDGEPIPAEVKQEWSRNLLELITQVQAAGPDSDSKDD